MRPTLALRGGGGGPVGKYGLYLTSVWGNLGSLPQKGIVTYGVSANRQNPFAGAFHDAIFNTWRRFASQVWYWAPPVIVGYYTVDWAIKRNHYLYTKAGEAERGD